MKVIVSHDIDHMTVLEHAADLIVPKHLARNTIELLASRIGFKQYFRRIGLLWLNKWQNLDELMSFDKSNEIPATFFIGVNKGLGMCYGLHKAIPWIKNIISNGFDCGVHGIEFGNKEGLLKEYTDFESISGKNAFGIRMHYLRKNEQTLLLLSKAGYLFDSSVYADEAPYKIGNLWEFPLHIMDGYEIEGGKSWQSVSLEKALDSTKRKIEKIHHAALPYLTILFHDRYFNPAFHDWMKWYTMTISYLKENSFNFIDYRTAVMELEKTV